MTHRQRTIDTRTSGALYTLTTDRKTANSNIRLPITYPYHTVSSQNYPQSVVGSYKSIDDYTTKNFAKLIAKGRIINNPCIIAESVFTDPVMNLEYSQAEYYGYSVPPTNYRTEDIYRLTEKNGSLPLSQIMPHGFLPLMTEFASDRVRDLAVTQAYANINDSDLLINTCIAESGKTVRDLLTLSRKVIKVLKAIKHPTRLSWKQIKRDAKRSEKERKRLTSLKRKRYLKSAMNESEELYMQARYNLRPLYYDILGTMKLGVKPYYIPRHTYRGMASDSNSSSDDITVTNTTLFPGINFLQHRKSSYTVEARAGVLCSVPDRTAWMNLGIQLIPETLWELTPFSFILDWFGNFGQVISSWSPSPGIATLASWVTIETTHSQTISAVPQSTNTIIRTTNYPGSLQRIVTDLIVDGQLFAEQCSRTYKRFISPSRPFTPRLNFNVDTLKSLDLAIIGKNLLKSVNNAR